MGYLTNFIVYTMAMVGILGIAIVIFKNSTGFASKSGTKYMKVLDTLSLGPRKTLYIISAGEEKFLIAGDVDRTTLISKLNSNQNSIEKISAIATSDKNDYSTKSFSETMKTLPKENYMDMSLRQYSRNSVGEKTSVMRKLARKMSTAGSMEE